jgi:hypothetical protein
MSAPSWILSRALPRNEFSIPTQSTAFAQSNLAAASSSEYVYDDGRQVWNPYFASEGNGNRPNTILYSTDKSPLGVETVRLASGVTFTKPNPLTVTTPNVNSLDSDYRYYPPFSN